MSARIAPTNDVIVKPKILVLYYSMYGHVKTMADEFAKGVADGGAEAVLMQVPETLSEEVLAKMVLLHTTMQRSINDYLSKHLFAS